MGKISELTNIQYNLLAERSLKGHKYFFETSSLLYELKKLEVDHRAELIFWRAILGVIFSKDLMQENYIFYVKNSIYRIYDLVNKYARMIKEYYRIRKLQNWNDFKNISSSQYDTLPSNIKVLIQELINNQDLRDILKSRHSMTHNQIVRCRNDYISHWVLPLGGEEAITFDNWKENSEGKLIETLESLTNLFMKTVEAIINEKV